MVVGIDELMFFCIEAWWLEGLTKITKEITTCIETSKSSSPSLAAIDPNELLWL